MLQALLGRGPLRGVEGEHGDEEVGELLGGLRVPLVLLGQHVVQAPRLQLRYVAQLAWKMKKRRMLVMRLIVRSGY